MPKIHRISEKFCAQIFRAGAISARYQTVFCFLACNPFYVLGFSEQGKLC